MNRRPPVTEGRTGDAAPGRLTVRLHDVTVHFPRRRDPVLSVADLELSAGERLLVLGPSGAGKSTLLDVLSGVVPHTVTSELRGEVAVCGRATPDTSVVELSRHIAVLGQDPVAGVCLPTVEQELALPLENHATPVEAIDGRIDDALAAVGAAALRHRRTATLSGGEGQLVALAASLVAGPDLLLLDEPTSMLDPAGVAAVARAWRRATSRHRPTVVMVEHRLDALAGDAGLAGLPERSLVLDPTGTAVALGPTPEVLRRHAADLQAAGCWLPLEAELAAASGVLAGPDHPAHGDRLDRPGVRPSGDSARGEVLLRARDLAVSRTSSAPPILRGVDLTLRAGEVTALLGGNGFGKSTLLLTLAGLLPRAAGELSGDRPAMVFQNPEHQFLAHTVAAEIGHGLSREAGDRVARQLDRHRLTHLADQNPFRLSGGEQRRLSIAAMLAHDRAVLLLDEPTLGLDRRDTVATLRTLREAADEGRAVLLASHDLRSVATVADRIVVLGGGRVLLDGPAEDVLSSPELSTRAGLRLPRLVQWLQDRSPGQVRSLLQRLDDELAQAATACAASGAAGGGAA